MKPPIGPNAIEPTAAPIEAPVNLTPAFATSATPCPTPCSFVALKILGNSKPINIKLPIKGIFDQKPLPKPFKPPKIPLLPAAFAAVAPPLVAAIKSFGVDFIELKILEKTDPLVRVFFATFKAKFPPPSFRPLSNDFLIDRLFLIPALKLSLAPRTKTSAPSSKRIDGTVLTARLTVLILGRALYALFAIDNIDIPYLPLHNKIHIFLTYIYIKNFSASKLTKI